MNCRCCVAVLVLVSWFALFAQDTPKNAQDDDVARLLADSDSELRGQHNKELANAKEAVRQKPTDAYVWHSLGEAYVKLGDLENADESLKRALQLFLAAPPPTYEQLKAGDDKGDLIMVYMTGRRPGRFV